MQLCNIDNPVYIQTDDELALWCKQWSNSQLLALDTEFIRTDTFYPIVALVQVCDGDNCCLIDPLSIKQMEPLKALLVDQGIVKVLHSCGEDLEVFDRLLGVVPTPIFDTQIAAAIDGYGFSLGYQRLTKAMLQVHIAKGETRSNWLQRPLSASQVHYAALDVACLPQMYSQLMRSLTDKGRLTWLQEECQQLLEKFSATDQDDQYYKKIKSAWKLSKPELGILQSVTLWREQCARTKNVPRARVLKDKSCYEIARIKPKNLRVLANIENITAKQVKDYGGHLLNIVKQAHTIEHCRLPERLPRPLPVETNHLLKLLKAHVNQCAEQLNIAQELLARKRDYEALLRSGLNTEHYQLPLSMMGWRKTVIGEQLLAILVSSNTSNE